MQQRIITMTISLDQANAIANAAMAAATGENVSGASVVVTDAGGHIRTAMRMEGAGNFGIDIALAKAVTALGLGRSSSEISKIFGANPAAVAGLAGATAGRFLPIGGAVLIRDETGTIQGAAACAGSLPETDERYAAAAVRAAGLQT
jgi:uncharacterized protein GlcG (DUF336 family)